MFYDLHNNIDVVRAITMQTITTSALASSGVDLAGAHAVKVVFDTGDIAEMGSSPEGSAEIAYKIEHSDDNVTFANCADKDVVGATGLASGVFATKTTDLTPTEIGYVGGKRYIKVTATPTGLSTGGPIAAHVLKGMLTQKPAS
jgi:hypothetical protein